MKIIVYYIFVFPQWYVSVNNYSQTAEKQSFEVYDKKCSPEISNVLWHSKLVIFLNLYVSL